MDVLVNYRNGLKGKINRILTTVNKHATTPLDNLDVELYLKELDTHHAEVDRIQKEMFEKHCPDDAAMDIQSDVCEWFDGKVRDIKKKLVTIQIALAPADIPTTGTGGSGPTPDAVKMPRLETQTFDGNYEDWTSFSDSFQNSIHSKSMPPHQKLQYLKGLVKGEAANLIKSQKITDSNYGIAWTTLENRYKNERVATTTLLRKLYGQSNMTRESADGLQLLLDTTCQCVQALEVLGQPVQHWDTMLVYMVVERMDSESRRQWALTLKGTSNPTFNDLKVFITQYVGGLKAGGGGNTQRPERSEAAGVSGERRRVSSQHSVAEDGCVICLRRGHDILKCRKFKSMSPEDRGWAVRRAALCLNCLSSGHRASDCGREKCKECAKPHHFLLHFGSRARVQEKTKEADGAQVHNGTSMLRVEGEVQVLLSTAVVKIEDRFGESRQCRVLLDSGSQASFITEACVMSLGLKRLKTDVTITGISATKVGHVREQVSVSLSSCVHPASVQVDALILPKVTGTLPRYPCESSKWAHLIGLKLADPGFAKPGPIDILLGAGVFASVMREGRRTGTRCAPIAQNSIFGWVLSGRVAASSGAVVQVNHCETDTILRRFWELEELAPMKHYTAEEKACESHFVDTHARDSSGRFIVQLPFLLPPQDLGLSRQKAVSRLLQVERRLAKLPDRREQYLQFMEEYEALNHMEPIPAAEVQSDSVFYLPHPFVLKEESSTTKFRVVFDGSCESSNGLSLNKTLMVGPTIQDDLFSLLLRFRCHVVGLKADISKMFRQFRVSEDDVDYQRIVWRKSPDHPIKDFRLLTLTYGTGPASFLATRCLSQLAKDEEVKFPSASGTLTHDLYVDDLLSGAPTPQEAIELQTDLCELVKSAGMEFRKWASSDPLVLNAIPPELREKSESLSFDTDDSLKALGVKWNPTSDNFVFEVTVPVRAKKLTKRTVLSELAKVFDPLGLLTPTTIRAKILFQDLWKLEIGWDDELPAAIKGQWVQYQEELPIIKQIKVPRCVVSSCTISQQVLGFCDASEKAYAAVVYLRSELSDGTYQVRLLTSKTRVAPIKQVSIPRLELCGAVLLCDLVKTVQTATKLKGQVILWSDSTTVLDWIAGYPGKRETFVANRVAMILDSFPSEHWRYVPGTQNPGDCASRGIPASELVDFSLWWDGPEWLLERTLPIFPYDIDNRVRHKLKAEVDVRVNHVCLDNSLISRFSSLQTLKRVTGYCMRFVNNLRKKSERKSGRDLSPEEVHDGFLHLIRHAQEAEFALEMQALRKAKEIPASSKLKSLCPFVDLRGILRVGGRIQKAGVPESQKHQIILPPHHPLTKLIIRDGHLSNLHAGFQLLWSTLQREFWILRARDTIRHEVRKCVTCRKNRAEMAQQLMGSLPSARVNPGRPFLHSGVDYAGPFLTRVMKVRNTKTFKSYLCIFVCLATKAVHLEAVSDMTTDGFLAAFKRFTARRGASSHLYSDCGTNFGGADNELKEMLLCSQHNEALGHFLLEKGTTWSFNPPSAPHQGGLWEAGVKSAKFHMKRVIGNTVLTFEEFSTVLCQIEACLNSRPLCAMSSDPADFDVLTPGHFLIGEPLNAIPEGDLTDLRQNRLSRWQLTQQMVQHFWKRWSAEYLSTLQQRFKWTSRRADLMVGDLVLIKDDDLPPNKWNRGRITETHPG